MTRSLNVRPPVFLGVELPASDGGNAMKSASDIALRYIWVVVVEVQSKSANLKPEIFQRLAWLPAERKGESQDSGGPT